MIRLFGVVHDGFTIDLQSGRRKEIELEPTSGLEKMLRTVPVNSKVGIEFLNQEDLDEVKNDLRNLCWENDFSLCYPSPNVYWNKIIQISKSCGHTVILLEDKSFWLKYNRALVELGKTKEKYDELYQEEGESDREYHKKLVTSNEELYQAKINSDRIHFIERDDAILRNIIARGPQVVVAGIGHTDVWILNQERIKKDYGIEFGQYSTDSIADIQRSTLKFTENAAPDKSVAHEYTSLKKAICLLEKGRFSDEVPDWVGTWNVIEPSSGYFELFIGEQKHGSVRGRIEDCLGTAVFEGKITPSFVRFIKQYRDSARDAIKSDTVYETKDSGYDRDVHQGFRSKGDGRAFYMEKPGGNSPLEMSLAWYDLRDDDESGQKRFF